ncbi:MAG: nucleotidyltransferase domain-containing protein [Ginsengibacter sp.]
MSPSKSYNQNLLIRNDILSTLTYFDIFTYPLKKREIWLFLQNLYHHSEFEIALQVLIKNCLIFKLGEFYSLQNNYSIVQRRIKGNDKAEILLAKAKKIASLLSGFPFVRGVAVSGSLSKNFADDTSDIDLFIITTRNRLWIARTIMHGFKKLTLLVNKQHLYCMNYFVDEDHVEIAEKNIYTATEIATLIPLHGITAFEKFYSGNSWTKMFLPNKYLRVSSEKLIKTSGIKWVIEKMLSNSFGNMLDNILMKITAKRWHKKTLERKRNTRRMVMSMCATKFCAKRDPKNFQSTFINVYERRVFELLHKKIIVMRPVN